MAKTSNNIGFIYDKKGEYEKALKYYNKNLKIITKIFGPESIEAALTLNNIGSVHDKKGEYDKALEKY